MKLNIGLLYIRWILLLIGLLSIVGCKPFYELELLKKQLKRSIKNSVAPIQNGRFSIGQNAWSIAVDNVDENILKKDSFVCFTNHIDTCSYVQWTFYNRESIHQSYIDACKEPSTRTVSKVRYIYRIEKGDYKKPVLIIQQFAPMLGDEVKFYFNGISKNTQNVNVPGYIIHLSKI